MFGKSRKVFLILSRFSFSRRKSDYLPNKIVSGEQAGGIGPDKRLDKIWKIFQGSEFDKKLDKLLETDSKTEKDFNKIMNNLLKITNSNFKNAEENKETKANKEGNAESIDPRIEEIKLLIEKEVKVKEKEIAQLNLDKLFKSFDNKEKNSNEDELDNDKSLNGNSRREKKHKDLKTKMSNIGIKK